MRRLLAAATVFVSLLVVACGGDANAGVTRGPASAPLVALTFDDGLNGETTRQVADLLEQAGMQGTFFIVGQTVEGQASLARALLEHGHVIGNHSYDHERAQADDREYVELGRAEAEFRRVLGVCPRYFRPPYGTETRYTKAAVRGAGMRTILWDVEVADWSEDDAARLAQHVLERVRPGSVVLLHDGSDGHPGADRTVLLRALPTILEGLRAKGLRSVGVDELLGERPYLASC